MKPKSDKEIADEIRARRELESQGYSRVRCKTCEGGLKMCRDCCPTCHGKGYSWQSPIMC